MNQNKDKRVCPVERSGGLDNSARRLLQNPQKILKPYIKAGMTVLDVGCGPGFFTLEIAKLLVGSGEVIAADLQEGMLDIVRQKIKGTELEKIIRLHKCEEESINLQHDKVDFVLVFYMAHEVPNQDKFFSELKSLLKPGGLIFVVEPKFHVPKRSFESMVARTKNIGLEALDRPKVFFSRAVLLKSE